MNRKAGLKIHYKLFGLIVAAFAFLIFQSPVKAASFNVQIDRQYYVETDKTVHVIETHKVTNNSDKLISKDNTEKFQLSVVAGNTEALTKSVATAKITTDDKDTTYTSDQSADFTILTVGYPADIFPGNSITFKLDYTNYGLVLQSGALYDIYMPGFAKDVKFLNGNTEATYTTAVRVNKAFPALNFVIPDAIASKDFDANYTEYDFSQESLVGKTVWIQEGRKQFYDFAITETAPATETLNTGNKNEYTVILPRDIDEQEVYQTVNYSSFSPEPESLSLDDNGNLIAKFKVPSNQDTTITAQGYAEVGLTGDKSGPDNSGSLQDYNQAQIAPLLKAANFWEVDAPEISSAAAQIKSDETNVYSLIEKTYSFVIDKIDYSQVKRFGINERKGALKTLEEGAGVCMEYSDLFLALARAEGVPTRAVFGYGYDSKLTNSAQESHQWVEVFLPSINKWISVDVTWGESGPALIGGDLNHFYTHVASVDPETPAPVERKSFGDNSVALDVPNYQITAQTQADSSKQYLTQTQLLAKYPVKADQPFAGNLGAILAQGSVISSILIGGGVTLMIVSLFVAMRASKPVKRHPLY